MQGPPFFFQFVEQFLEYRVDHNQPLAKLIFSGGSNCLDDIEKRHRSFYGEKVESGFATIHITNENEVGVRFYTPKQLMAYVQQSQEEKTDTLASQEDTVLKSGGIFLWKVLVIDNLFASRLSEHNREP